MSESTRFPADWRRTTFGEIADYINGRAFKPEEWKSSGLPIIRIQQMNDPEAGCDYCDQPVAHHFYINNGDLLFSWSATLMTLIWDRGPAVLNQHIFKVVPSEGNDVHYLHHLLEHQMENLAGQTHGSTMRHIKRSDLLPFPVVVPHQPEQRAIAAILDTADEAIRATERVIAKLEMMKQGLLHDLLTRGLDENGELRDLKRRPELFTDSALGRIPNAWTVCPLSSIADLDRGKFTHRPRNDPAFYGGRHPFIQTGDVTVANGRLLVSFSQTLNSRGAAVSKEFPAGTIAVTIAANIADTAILGSPMYFPDSIVGAVVRAPHDIRYVELCIRRAKGWLDAQAPQSAQKNINLEILRPMLVAVPRPAEQVMISAAFEAHEARVQSEEASLQKLRLVKRGLMDDLLTGRVRVREVGKT